MVLGLLVVLIAGILIVKYLRTDRGSLPEELLTEVNSIQRDGKLHKVEKGENLWKIAEQYYGDGYKWVDIATENKLANASVVEVGQELVIPETDESSTDEVADTTEETNTPEATVTKTTSTDAITAATYEVVRGDSLWKIAVRAYGDGYKWVEIKNENKLVNPNIIHPGNILALPR